MMEKYEIQKLRELPIEKVAKEMGMKVEHHKALCPFHDDHHASLTFSTKKNSCRCYVCMGNSLGTIDLVMRYLGKDFLSACRWLAEEHQVQLEEDRKREGGSSSGGSSSGGSSSGGSSSGGSSSGDSSSGGSSSGGSSSGGSSSGGSSSGGSSSGGSSSGGSSSGSSSGKSSSFDASKYAKFFEHPWLNEAARRFLFEERKIDWRVVNWCRLTSWTDKKGVNWLQIPYFDMEGRLIGIQNRNLDYRKTPTETKGLAAEKTPTDFTDDTDAPSLSAEAEGLAADKTPTDFTDDTDASLAAEAEGLATGKTPTDFTDASLAAEAEGLAAGKTPTDFTDDTDASLAAEAKGLAAGKTPTDFTDASLAADAPRFRFPYGARCSIYNLPVVKRLQVGESLFITEGCSDCWAMLSAGHKAIAIPSATLLKPDDKKWLAEIGSQLKINWHMFPDKDAPGEQLFLQLKEILPSLVHHQLPPGCKDFSEYYQKSFCPFRATGVRP